LTKRIRAGISGLSKHYFVTKRALRYTFKFSRFHGVIGSVYGPALTQQPQLSTVRHELQRDHRRCWRPPFAITIIILLSALTVDLKPKPIQSF
jgi:hypothetical protein